MRDRTANAGPDPSLNDGRFFGLSDVADLSVLVDHKINEWPLDPVPFKRLRSTIQDW